MPDHACSFVSGDLKFSWKLLSGSNLQETSVLLLLDVVHETVTNGPTPVTLILTLEALFVINAEEDAQETVFTVQEIEIKEDKEDPTKFSILVKSGNYPNIKIYYPP